MSIKPLVQVIKLEDLEQLYLVVDKLEESFKHHSKLHKDFSAVLEVDDLNNEVTVKTLYLNEHIN